MDAEDDEGSAKVLANGILKVSFQRDEQIIRLALLILEKTHQDGSISKEEITSVLTNLINEELDNFDIEDFGNMMSVTEQSEAASTQKKLAIEDFSKKLKGYRNSIQSRKISLQNAANNDETFRVQEIEKSIKETEDQITTIETLKKSLRSEKVIITASLKARRERRLKVAEEVLAAIIDTIRATGI